MIARNMATVGAARELRERMTMAYDTDVAAADRGAEMAARFDLKALPADFYDDPYPWYAAVREHAPLKRMPDGSLFLTRAADLETVYRNPALFSSDKTEEFKPKFGLTPIYEHHTTSLVFNDPPLHTHVRRVLQGALMPRAIGYMEPQLVTLIDRLLDEAQAESDAHGSVDLVETFAAAIPIEVIGNLLAIPHADRGPLRGWSLMILGALEPVVPPEMVERASDAVIEFLSYLERLIADRRAHMRDPDLDVLSRLILGEQNGERLTEHQLMQNCIFLLNAGHETTTNFIGNSLNALMEHPDQRARLIAEPGLITSALEELLRFESPNQLGNRAVVEATELAGERLEAGTLITTCIGAANRDPARHAEPDRLDLTRAPNRHLAFASGTHLCLGMNLAKLEGRIALTSLLARFPDYRRAGPPVRGRRVRFRGLAELPVRLR